MDFEKTQRSSKRAFSIHKTKSFQITTNKHKLNIYTYLYTKYIKLYTTHTYELPEYSSKIGFPGNSIFKSSKWVIYNLDWFVKQPYSTLAFRNPERLNNLIQSNFLAFGPYKFIKSAQTLVDKTGMPGGIPVPLRSIFLMLGLAFNTRYTSFRFESFIITFWEALLVDLSRWQSSTF